MLGRTDSRARHLLILVGFVAIAGAILFRLAFWQVARGEELAAMAYAQTTIRTEELTQRGTIYDRTGAVVLASTVERSRVVAAPGRLSEEQREQVGQRLAAMLGLEGGAAAALIAKMHSDDPYVVLTRGLDEATSDRIRSEVAEGRLLGITLEGEPVRVYPQDGGGPGTTLASHLLGFVNSAGDGQYGIEQHYQDALGGEPRIVMARRNATGGLVSDEADVIDPGADGVDVSLTIDASLQLALEQELLAAWVADRAVSVSAVVMDPYTGEIYGQATYPAYNANDYQAIATADKSRFMDPIVSGVYEPGSVLKMLTAVAALEHEVVGPTTLINDTASLVLDKGRAVVKNADHKGMGKIPFQDVVAYSRNVGASKVALRLGRTTKAAAVVLYDTWVKMGLGAKTGVDLAGEVGGLIADPRKRTWRQIDLANGAFGQGVAVTPIQLAASFSAMVNGGVLVQPHVVKAIGGAEVTPTPPKRVMTPKRSATLVKMMNHVVTEVAFYANGTLADGYYVGGKTGTAQIWDATANGGKGAWKNNIFNYSFVGFIGKDKPRLVVAVRVHEGTPTVLAQGHIEMPVMSFELFRRVATDAMKILDLSAPKSLASVK